MSKTGFAKATSKMFAEPGASVQIATPGGGRRPSKAERDIMRKEADRAALEEAGEMRENERRAIINTLKEMNVIPSGAGEGSGKSVHEESSAEEVQEEKQGRGRPVKNPEVKEYVLMNFRVPADFRQRLKVLAAEEGRSLTELFEEAFVPLLEKYGK